jgi:hypothetical protein
MGEFHVDGLGVVRHCERVRTGAFDLYRGELDGVAVAIKVKGLGFPDDNAYVAEHSVVFSRLYSAIGYAGRFAPRAPGEELLAHEAERIRASAGTWNHDVLAAGPVRSREGEPGVFGLVMPWHPGPTLAELPRQEQRQLLPRMMISLWKALAAAAHGDLHGSNIILAPERDRFVLIDPAVFLVDRDLHASGDSKSRCSFTTHPRYYPLLPPYYLPRTRLRDAPYLASQFEAFRWALSGCQLVAPGYTTGGATSGFAEQPVGRDEPGPADLLAVGILYYEALTGEHPFYDDEFTEPGWLGGVCLEGFRGSDIGFDAALVRLARPVVPPAARAADVHPDESALAMALLELRVHDLDTLVARAYPAAVAAQG